MVFRFDSDVEGVKCLVTSVEVHVDFLPPNICRWKSETINGMNMLGCLSVRFPEGELTVIKVGKDETIFKMSVKNNSSWELEKLKQMSKKIEGKGNMKLAFVCKIIGLGGNATTK